jgi:hypothetical protein
LSAGAGLALILLAFIPIQGASSPAQLSTGSNATSAGSVSPAPSDNYLVGSFTTVSLAVEISVLDADVRLPASSSGQVPPSLQALDTTTTVGRSGDTTTDPSVGQPGVRQAWTQNTPMPKLAQTGLASTATAGPAPLPLATPQLYKRDLYDGSRVRYQDPDMTACTATATEMMLNFTASKGTTDEGFVWSPTTSYGTQESILAWERANDTLEASAPGSDPHGWRNALNHYGWTEFTDPRSRHYEDLAYSSYASAVKAAVVAIATENQPVGILGWAGGHAQIMTGYEVYGADPAVSSDFTVEAVYLTDPLAADRIRDLRIPYAAFGSGSAVYRFQAYTWRDSPIDDPYMPGSLASYREWYGKWVIVAPIGVSSASPAGPAS